MRTGEVIGKVTLSVCDPYFVGGRYMLIQPKDSRALREGTQGHGEVVVAYDELGAGQGDLVGFSEGREAAMPFVPDNVAVDAYVACLLDDVHYDI